MSLPPNLQPFADKPTAVLDQGHVLLVDVMGDEQAIVDAARVSYGAGTKSVSDDRHLIRYLMRHKHTTPFEMCELKIRVRVPMDVWRQWVRHRTASINEYSTRYSEAIDATVKTDPTAWRVQAKDNKQGSDGFITDWPSHLQESERSLGGPPGSYLTWHEGKLHDLAREVYEERLAFGVAREQARKDLPLSTYTEAYWKCDLHNLLHFLRLRMDPHAQLEIRQYAEAIAAIVKVWVPTVWEAFEDYALEAETFTAFEMAGMREMLESCLTAMVVGGMISEEEAMAYLWNQALHGAGIKGREIEEFRTKFNRLFPTKTKP